MDKAEIVDIIIGDMEQYEYSNISHEHLKTSIGKTLDEYATEVSRENNKKTAVDFAKKAIRKDWNYVNNHDIIETLEEMYDKWKSKQEESNGIQI